MFERKYKKEIIYPFLTLNFFLLFIVLFVGFTTSWIYSVLFAVVQMTSGIIAYKSFNDFKIFYEQYISTLSRRLQKTRDQAFNELPIGVLLYNSELEIEWANPFMISIMSEDTLIGRSIFHVAEEIAPILKNEVNNEEILINDRIYRSYIRPEERVLFLFDVTDHKQLQLKHEEEQIVIGLIYLDNYDEVTQGVNDQVKSHVNALVSSILTDWAENYGMLIRRMSSDRYIALMNNKTLLEVKKSNFNILDEVREQTFKEGLALTLSIGIGVGECPLHELASLAQSSLDLTLGRGGDQVSIKYSNGQVKFFGGKTNPVEKRTRVRARVISHALKELINDSDQVFIMGHKLPDMDSIGASIGIQKIAEMNDKISYIVLDLANVDQSVNKLLLEIKTSYPNLWDIIISPEQAMEMATKKTLLVVVDTHKPSMTIEERLIHRLDNIVVIDHHRRGEEFVQDAILVYMEPYASSTSELVTELLEYQTKSVKINIIESTALLAGIIVDTKSFTLRTGSRTFDAASYLRQHGADTVLAQKLLKEEKNDFIRRARIVSNSYIYKKGIAISLGNNEELFDQVIIAQAADTLLTMNEINASFVIAKRSEGVISISARSLGDLNVQIIMESLNGGGHLTNAATQINSESIEQVEKLLQHEIDAYLEGGKKE